jgi:hypothetical protein
LEHNCIQIRMHKVDQQRSLNTRKCQGVEMRMFLEIEEDYASSLQTKLLIFRIMSSVNLFYCQWFSTLMDYPLSLCWNIEGSSNLSLLMRYTQRLFVIIKKNYYQFADVYSRCNIIYVTEIEKERILRIESYQISIQVTQTNFKR